MDKQGKTDELRHATTEERHGTDSREMVQATTDERHSVVVGRPSTRNWKGRDAGRQARDADLKENGQ